MVAQLQDRLGFDLPLEQLRYWLLGIPDPSSTFELSRNAQDRIMHLVQLGWNIDYDRYVPDNGDLMPARLVLSRADARVRIAVDRWAWLQMTQSEARPWPAPAKLNLFLHVLGRRPDGYHELQTCFQFIDLCDDIAIRVRSDGEIRRGSRARQELYRMRTCVCVRRGRSKPPPIVQFGADITVLKRIPMGAGLGRR